MKMVFSKDKIAFDKILSKFDGFVMDFADVLRENNIDYVTVAGYVAILFGRSRISEDADFIIERLDFDRFNELWASLGDRYECINVVNVNTAYNEYLLTEVAVRFAEKGRVIPNIEFKFPKTELDKYTLDNRIKVECGGRCIYISPLELQIAYKMFMGSEKDVEDARFIYQLLKEHLNKGKLDKYLNQLKVSREDIRRYLGE